MPHSEYDGDDSVDEDAELELSCALHDLAERVKLFEENMKGRLRINGLAGGGDDDGDEEEIGEDIPEIDDDHSGVGYGYASPKKKKSGRRRGYGAKSSQAKQQGEDGDSSEEMDEDEEDEDDAKGTDAVNNKRNDWNERNEREELSEMKHNIATLLEGFKEQAKALEANNQ